MNFMANAVTIDREMDSEKAICLELCDKISDELNKDLLQVETKTITHNREFSTKSTVRNCVLNKGTVL